MSITELLNSPKKADHEQLLTDFQLEGDRLIKLQYQEPDRSVRIPGAKRYIEMAKSGKMKIPVAQIYKKFGNIWNQETRYREVPTDKEFEVPIQIAALILGRVPFKHLFIEIDEEDKPESKPIKSNELPKPNRK